MQALITLHVLLHVDEEEEAASFAIKMGQAAQDGATNALRESYDTDPDMIGSAVTFSDIQEQVDKLVRFLPTQVTILPEGVVGVEA